MTNSKPGKVGRPRTTGKSPVVLVAMPPKMLAAVDDWRARHPGNDFEELSRPAAVRALVARALKKD